MRLPPHAYQGRQSLGKLRRRIAELEAEIAAQAAATVPISNITQMLRSVSDAVVVADLDLRIRQWNPAAEALYGWPAAEVLGRRTAEFLAVGYPDGHTRERVLQALQSEGSWRGEAIVTRRDGQERVIEAATQLLYDPSGTVVGSLSISRDITQARAAAAERERLLVSEQQARAAAEAASRRLAVLADASAALLAAALDLPSVMEVICQRAATLIGDTCFITLLDEASELLRPMASAHPDPEALAALREAMAAQALGVGEGMQGRVIQTGAALYLPAVDRSAIRPLLKPAHRQYVDRFGLTSVMVVPIRSGGRAIGTLHLSRDGGGEPYTPDDLQLLQELADRVALAVTSARLYADVEAALQAKDAALTQLDTLFASAPVGLAFLDDELRYVRANQMLAQLGGVDAGACLGHTTRELMPELAAIIEPLQRRVLQAGEVIRDVPLRSVIPAAPGAPRDWLASYYPVPNSQGAVIGVGAVVVETTERLRAERELKERTTWLEIAAEAAELGIWRRDFSTELVQLDARAQAHYGYDRPEGPVSEVLARAHPEDVAPVRLQVAAALGPASDGRYAAEYRMIHPDGTLHWLAVRGRLFFTGEGADRRPALSVGTSQDITARKQIEQERRDNAAALRASEEHFRLLAEHAQDLIFRYRLGPEPGFEYVSPAATAITGYTPEEHYADPGLGMKLVEPEDRHLLAQSATDPASGPLTLRWRRKDGVLIWTEQVNRLFFDAAGRPVAIEGIARDITARKEAEEQVRAALAAEQEARQAAEQAAVYSSRLEAMAAALSAALTQDAVAEVVIEHGRSIAGASAVVVALLDPAGEHVTVISVVGRDAALFRDYMATHISAVPPLAHSIRAREPLWVSSPEEAEARFPGSAALMAKFGDQAKATLPLVAGSRVIGVINLSFATRVSFSPQERALLTTLAQQCAQALDRARLYDEIVETRQRLQQLSQRLLEAQEQERRHIARELHDEVGQVLGAMKINLHLLGAQTGDAPQLAESLGMVDTLIQQVRTLSLELRPSILDDLGLAAALAWYCDRLQQRSGLALTFDDRLDALPVPMLVATACFRIAQEALTNVARHARARRVAVTLAHQDAMLVLAVQDDGIGFDVHERRARAAAGDSLGLISMVERAELLGGWVDLSSTPGEGTEIWVWLPLDTPPANDPA